MTELAGFLKQRDSVSWALLHGTGGKVMLRASHPETLAHQAWFFPQDYYRDAKVVEGQATVRVQDGMVIIAATNGRHLSVELVPSPDAGHSTTPAMEAHR
jgi:hypothetical protein